MSTLRRIRIRRTEAQWKVILAEQERSGQTQAGFCQTRHLAYSTFLTWRGRLRGKVPGREKQAVAPRAQFVELPAWPVSAPEVAVPGTDYVVELTLGNGMVVRIGRR